MYCVALTRLPRLSCLLRAKSGQDTVGDTLQPSSWDSRNFMAMGHSVGDRATPRLRHGLAVPPIPIPQAVLFILLYFGPFGGSDGKGSVSNAGDLGLISGLRFPGLGNGNPLQYSCLENPHGRRSLVGYSPWGCRVGQD